MFINRIDAIDKRVWATEIALTSLKEVVNKHEEILKVLSQEHKDMPQKLNDIAVKIAGFEILLKLTEDRYKTISERILTINARLDSIGRSQALKRGDPIEQP